MSDPEEMFPSWVSWCFDGLRRPVCPSLWDERDECDGVDCPFSHQVENVYLPGTCALPLRLLEEDADARELENYLREHAQIEGGVESGAPVIEQTQSEQDEEDVRRICKEMDDFENGKQSASDQRICQYFLETGNCLQRALCGYRHDPAVSATEEPEDVNSRWYPAWKDCGCCQGYIYKCDREGCRGEGKCIACQGAF